MATLWAMNPDRRDMKKIGILTFHRAYNFGAVLQSYAVQQAIRSISDDVDACIIDYRCNRIESWFHSKTIKSKLKNVYRFCFHHNYYVELRKKEKLFNSFTKRYFILSPKCISWKDFYNHYDAIVVGSDQVWNMDMTQNDINFFLPYEIGARKLTYAASFGKSEFSEEQKGLVRKFVGSFDSVLIREEAGVRFAESLGITSRKVVDPTLLISCEHWKTLCEPCDVTKPFILLYIVAKETYCVSLAKKIAEEKGWDVIYLDPPRFDFEGVTRMKDTGPGQFLWLIQNAKLVVTTSYHGLIFSLNLNTPFLYEMAHVEGNTNSRLEEVVDTYDLQDYAIQSDSIELYKNASYDWEKLNHMVEDSRNTSMDILRRTIEEE